MNSYSFWMWTTIYFPKVKFFHVLRSSNFTKFIVKRLIKILLIVRVVSSAFMSIRWTLISFYAVAEQYPLLVNVQLFRFTFRNSFVRSTYRMFTVRLCIIFILKTTIKNYFVSGIFESISNKLYITQIW